MTSKFDCFGPGFFAGFFKVGLPQKTHWVYPKKPTGFTPKNPLGFFGYVPWCPNPVFKTSGSIKQRTQTNSEIGIGCQRNGHWATTNHLSGCGLVQPFKDLSSAVGRCARRGCALIKQLVNMSRNKITVRFRDAQFCECSAALMKKIIGLYLLTDVHSHALIVVLWFSATLLNHSFALQACNVHVAKC